MYLAAYLTACVGVAIFSAYTLAFQGATIYWGKALAPDNELLPRGLQDAITPSGQSNRIILLPILYISVVAVGWTTFGGYAAFGAFLSTVFGSALVKLFFLPKPRSLFFATQILRFLVDRRAKNLAECDELRVEAADELIGRLVFLQSVLLGDGDESDPGPQ